MKTIQRFSTGLRSAVVLRNDEWSEYVVRFTELGKYMSEADYHSDDEQDAKDTAVAFVNAYNVTPA